MVNFTEFSEKELYKFNIHELRDSARELGVTSPTTRSKDELIQKMLEIVYGEAPAVSGRAQAGRPARRQNKPSKLLYELENKLTSEEYQDKDNPFVQKFIDDPAFMFDKSSDVGDKYDYNSAPITKNLNKKIKVANVISEYKVDSTTSTKPDKLESEARRIREIMGRTLGNAEPEEQKQTLNGLAWVSNYVIKGLEGKLLVLSEEDDEDYLIPENLKTLFAIKEGDILDVWVDKTQNLVVSISAINGNIVVM